MTAPLPMISLSAPALTGIAPDDPIGAIASASSACECDEANPEICDDPPEAEVWLYRDRTLGMLRRYLRFSIEVGRLPSLLGREFFRTRVTSYSVSTFEDAVIFVHDVERCLTKLDSFDRKLIAKMVFQDCTQDEAARVLNCGRRTVVRRLPEALDRISESFLEGGLLMRFPRTSSFRPESCQERETGRNHASDCEQGK